VPEPRQRNLQAAGGLQGGASGTDIPSRLHRFPFLKVLEGVGNFFQEVSDKKL